MDRYCCSHFGTGSHLLYGSDYCICTMASKDDCEKCEGSAGSDNHGKNNETKLGHFENNLKFQKKGDKNLGETSINIAMAE